MLPDDYAVVMDQLFQEVGHSYRHRNQPLTGFWPMCGKLYQPRKGLLVIGRAPNGWGEAWSADEIQAANRRSHEISALHDPTALSDRCPMSWLNGNHGGWTASRSPFFRVSRRVASAIFDVNEYDEDTWSYFAFSNLCKVAPHAGGNPNTSLWSVQLDRCIELLHMELETWRPRYVLAITGKDWCAPFLKALEVDINWNGGTHVDGKGRREGEVWVIAQRPEARPEDEFVGEVLDAFDVDHPLRETWKASLAARSKRRKAQFTAIFRPCGSQFIGRCAEIPIEEITCDSIEECREKVTVAVTEWLELQGRKSQESLQSHDTAEVIEVVYGEGCDLT